MDTVVTIPRKEYEELKRYKAAMKKLEKHIRRNDTEIYEVSGKYIIDHKSEFVGHTLFEAVEKL